MTMKGIAALVAAVASVALSSPPSNAQSDRSGGDEVFYGQIDDHGDEVVVGATTSRRTDVGESASSFDETVVTETALAPACEGNHPDNDNGSGYSLCLGAQSFCPPDSDGDAQVLMWRWTRQWDTATDAAFTDWEMQTPVCIGWDEIELPNIPLLVQLEFEERARLLEATVQIQPPGGRTLVNFDTIFYADDPSTTYNDIPIAGSSVDLQINADSYTWHFGDGASTTSDRPGRPYPDTDIVHRYDNSQLISARVDVTYSGRYRIDGGPWLDVAGAATVTGPEVPLTVVGARSELIAG